MVQEPRKATDLLLDLESKIGTLLDIVRAQDLNIKILSNKLNDVMVRLDKQQAGPPKIIVETVQTPPSTMSSAFPQMPVGDSERTIPVIAESKLPQDNSPQGFRRNSRPETYAGDNSYLPHTKEENKMPVQLPKMLPGRPNAGSPPPGRGPGPEVIVPQTATSNKKEAVMPPSPITKPQPMPLSAQGQIPVMQRCVDKNGKSIFLAEVHITDLSSSRPIFKGRTNGTGKWMASLGIGAYRVEVHKQGSSVRDKIEAIQDIQVDGSQSPLELPMLIIK